MKDVQERLSKVLNNGSPYYYAHGGFEISLLTDSDVTDNTPEINIIEHRKTPMYNDYEISPMI